MFLLDARLELSQEELYHFNRYNLDSFVVYDSDAYTRHTGAAYEHFDNATKVPVWEPSFGELASSLWNNIAGIAHGVMTAWSLRAYAPMAKFSSMVSAPKTPRPSGTIDNPRRTSWNAGLPVMSSLW